MSEQTHAVIRLQPRGDAPHAVFRVDAGEVLQLAYELDLTGSDTPDPRVSHGVPLVIDDYGVVTRSAALVYPRRGSGRVINADGTLSAATRARLVPSRSGVKTAYPVRE